jgi:uncharacterized protein YycO
MSDFLQAAGSASIRGGIPSALPRHIGGLEQAVGTEPQARADDMFEQSQNTAEAQSASKLGQMAKNVGKAVAEARDNIGSALTKVRKQGVYTATIVSGALSNVPFPTAIEPFPAEDRETVKSLLKPGDIILQKNEGAIIMQAMSKVVTGSDFVHAALYEGDGKMLESVVRGVREASVDEYLRGENSVQIVRPHYESEADLQAAIEFAKEQKGKPYNMLFDDRTKESYYCTQLVREAFQAMPHPIEVHVSDFMGKHIVGAGAFQNIPDAEVIYNRGGSFRDSVNGVSVGIHSSVVQAAFAGIPMFLSSAAIAPVLRSFS